MAVIEITEEQIFSDLETQFDSWVLLLWNDNNINVLVPVIALRNILGLEDSVIATIINRIELEGKAPVTSGSKKEMEEYSEKFRSYGLTVSITKS